MEGVLEVKGRTGFTTKLRTAKRLLSTIESMDGTKEGELLNTVLVVPSTNYWGRRLPKKQVTTGTAVEKLIAHIKKLERCVELEKKFKIVTLDTSCKRKVKHPGHNRGSTQDFLTTQLIWTATLPMRAYIHRNQGGWRLSAKTPAPTTEALKQIAKHKDKFESLQVWWVPNDIQIEKIPAPDPVLVGKINLPKQPVFFELCRWVDETVEDAWWSKEAY